MKRRAIAKVLVNASNQLFVVPVGDTGAPYEYIYREANGLRWDSSVRGLHAYEPARWEHAELLLHIVSAVRSACDEELHFTEQTNWAGVSAELQKELRASLP